MFAPFSLSLKHRTRPWLVAVLLVHALVFAGVAVRAQDEDSAPETPAVEAPSAPAPSVGRASAAPASSDEAAPVEIGDAPTIGANSHLLANEIAREFVTIMGDAVVDGRVRRDCVTILGNVTLNGRVDGNLVCIGGVATLGPKAEVRGNVVSIGGGIDTAKGARLRGQRIAILSFFPHFRGAKGWLGEWIEDGLKMGRILPHNHTWAWGVALVVVLFNLMLATIFHRAVQACSRALDERPVLSFLNGVIVSLLFVPLVVLLCITGIGIPLVPFAVIAKLLCSVFGTLGLYHYCGAQLGLRDRPVVAVLSGNLIFVLLYAVPVVSFAVWFVAPVIGLGAAVTALRAGRRKPTPPSAPFIAQPPAPTPVPAPVPPMPVIPLVPIIPVQPPSAEAPVPAAPEMPPATPAFSTGFVAPPAASAPASGVSAMASQRPAAFPPQLPPSMASNEVLERAGFWPRLFAMLLDFIFVAVGAGFLSVGGFLWLFVWLGYHVGFWMWRGTTPGGIIMNLRVERLDGRKIDFPIALARVLGGAISFLALGIGFVWASIDDERQSWHDKIAGTTVVRLRRSQSLV